MFYEKAADYHLSFTPFSLYPPAADRTSWETLDAEWKTASLSLGEKYLNFSYPSLSATDFMDFTRTGNRVRYENKLFSKRHALSALVLAECVENQGRFMDDIINGIFSICEESAWQLPPHNSYERDGVQYPLPDATAPVLDLFACETGAVLGTAFYLLKDALDAVSPFITSRIMSELEHRIFTPYLNCYFWWMGNETEATNNWTVWCTQNVLLSVFLTDTKADLKTSVLKKACKSTDYFLAGYGIDGCCDEGAQYYRHAGLCLFNIMETLNAVTGGHFSELYREPKIRNIASYILNVHIEDKYYVNFADCSPVAGRCSAREFLFALRTDNRSMAAFAAADFIAGMPDTLLLPSENNLYYRLQNGFTLRKIRDFASQNTGSVAHPDLFYPSVGLFIARDSCSQVPAPGDSLSGDTSHAKSSLYLAVKAGDNADSHNHNDTGSFTVYKNGRPLLIDVGVESYTRKTFSSRRYEIWTMQSAYHNLPTIYIRNDSGSPEAVMQKDGEQYKATDITHSFSDSKCEISMDISPAYPSEAGLLYYRRNASLLKSASARSNGEILIQDSFAFRDEYTCKSPFVTLSIMTSETPSLQQSTEGLSFLLGSLGYLHITGAREPIIETIPITDQRLQTAWKHDIYRIVVTASGNMVEMRIS